jgi:hypothetical protein
VTLQEPWPSRLGVFVAVMLGLPVTLPLMVELEPIVPEGTNVVDVTVAPASQA